RVNDIVSQNYLAGTHTIDLGRQWDWGTTYNYKFSATDKAGNQSKSVQFSLTTPDLGDASGSVFGATTEQPWGESNDYANRPSGLSLKIRQDGSYYWEGIPIAPLLTSVELQQQYQLYGWAVSKNSYLYIEAYQDSPSVLTAAREC